MATSHWPVGSLGPHEFRNDGEIRFTLPLQRNRELRKRLGQREGTAWKEVKDTEEKVLVRVEERK